METIDATTLSPLDVAFEQFKRFKAEFESIKAIDITESDTRSKVLDKIFENILGWKEPDITREEKVDSGYYDYKVELPGITFVVEAKRNFKEFDLPDRSSTISLQTLLNQNKEVINQIRGYLDDLGLTKGEISNGHQFIIGTFYNSTGKPWKQNQCLLFRGLDDIEERFFEFYDNLSREAVVENGGFKFEIEVKPIEFQKIVSNISGKDKELIRNTLSANIAPVIDQVFGEMFNDKIEDDVKFIEECFVENEESKKNRDEIDRLFEDQAPKLGEVIPAKNAASLRSQIASEMSEVSPSLKTSAPKPIIIIGSRGAGKTTFINHLFRTSLPEQVLENHPIIYIDFRDYYDQSQLINIEKIIKDVLEKIYDRYSELNLHGMTALKRIYFKEIQRNDASVWEFAKNNDIALYNEKLQAFLESKLSNSSAHFDLLSQYLIRDRRQRLVIVIDNADQFDSKIQELVFLFAQSLNKTAQCGVVISLREGYYYKWRASPPFDAFESNVYHITAPKYSEVLQRRIDFTLSRLSIEGESDGAIGRSMNISLKNQDIIEFLTSLKKTLFSNTNSPLIDFLKSTTFPNIREGLRIFKLFLISGHTNISEYILRERFNMGRTGKAVPIHEFVKSVGLNNKLYYDHEISALNNLFYPADNSKDHFIKIRVLSYLDKKLTSQGDSDRFDSVNNIVALFTNYGYRANIILKEVFALLKTGQIESDQLISDTDWKELASTTINICITAKGHYYINEIINKFFYLDLVLQDTPIFNQELFAELRASFPPSDDTGKRRISERIKTAEIFVKYLIKEEATTPKEILAKIGTVVNDEFIRKFEADISNAKLATQVHR